MNVPSVLFAALTAAPEKIPDLKPVRGAIPPTLWEAHGLALGFLAAITLVLLVAVVQRLRQPKPVVSPTPADLARRELTALRDSADPARANTEAARVVRVFLIARFKLAGPGLTADEIAARLPMHETLATDLHLFLNRCDVANFAPPGSAPSAETVIGEALGLIDTVERQVPPPLPVPGIGSLKSA